MTAAVLAAHLKGETHIGLHPLLDGDRCWCLGTGLLREAMALRGRMTRASYDRLFPSRDLLPAGGMGNRIAAPLFEAARDDGAAVFLDLETLERHEDQWAYLSALGRMAPAELERAADRAGKVAVAAEVTRLTAPSSTATRPPAPPVLSARLNAGIRLQQAELTPGLAATRGMRPRCMARSSRSGSGA